MKDNETQRKQSAMKGAIVASRREDFFAVEQEVNNVFHRMIDVLLAAEKLTPPQFICIERLREMNRPCKMSELADSIFMNPAVMTGVVDRLTDLDFIRRNLDESDRRVILLTLTAQGLRVLSRVDGKLRILARRFTALIPRADLDATVRVRRKYAEFLREELKSLKEK